MPINVIGITGPSGAGKSCFGELLRKENIPVIDADALYHSMLSCESPCTRAIAKEFGSDVLDENGCPDRKKLSATVFSSPEKLQRLNEVVLGIVLESIREIIAEHEKKGYKNIGVDAPTLIESGFHRECDSVVSVTASKQTRTERIIKRDGIDEKRAKARVEAQNGDEFYISNSDFVLTNDSDLAEFELCAKKIFPLILK